VADKEVTCALRGKERLGFCARQLLGLGRPGLRLRVGASGFVRYGSGVEVLIFDE